VTGKLTLKPLPALAHRTLLLAVLLSALVLAACTPSLPLVVVDEEHFHAFTEGPLAVSYQVPAGPGLTLDATGYPFVIPADAPEVPGPNMIQVVGEDEKVYSQPWNMQQTRYDLTPETLVNIETGDAFPGLAAGKSYVLGVGHLDAAGRFVVLWASWVDVKAN
jgi:hypothetical protein